MIVRTVLYMCLLQTLAFGVYLPTDWFQQNSITDFFYPSPEKVNLDADTKEKFIISTEKGSENYRKTNSMREKRSLLSSGSSLLGGKSPIPSITSLASDGLSATSDKGDSVFSSTGLLSDAKDSLSSISDPSSISSLVSDGLPGVSKLGDSVLPSTGLFPDTKNVNTDSLGTGSIGDSDLLSSFSSLGSDALSGLSDIGQSSLDKINNLPNSDSLANSGLSLSSLKGNQQEKPSAFNANDFSDLISGTSSLLNDPNGFTSLSNTASNLIPPIGDQFFNPSMFSNLRDSLSDSTKLLSSIHRHATKLKSFLQSKPPVNHEKIKFVKKKLSNIAKSKQPSVLDIIDAMDLLSQFKEDVYFPLDYSPPKKSYSEDKVLELLKELDKSLANFIRSVVPFVSHFMSQVPINLFDSVLGGGPPSPNSNNEPPPISRFALLALPLAGYLLEGLPDLKTE